MKAGDWVIIQPLEPYPQEVRQIKSIGDGYVEIYVPNAVYKNSAYRINTDLCPIVAILNPAVVDIMRSNDESNNSKKSNSRTACRA